MYNVNKMQLEKFAVQRPLRERDEVVGGDSLAFSDTVLHFQVQTPNRTTRVRTSPRSFTTIRQLT